MTAAVEAAWTEFRKRLADALAGIGDGVISITVESAVDPAQLVGAPPYVQFVSGRDGRLCAEVSSNHYLDAHYALAAEDEDLLISLGWWRPVVTADDEASEPDGPANFHLAAEPREADRVAVMAVQALREVFGCPHPVFLRVAGFRTAEDERHERDSHATRPGRPAMDGPDGDTVVVFPRNAQELQAAVDRALAPIFDEPLRHDDDGDIPVAEEDSVIFVRVVPDRPAVDLHCELVVRVGDLERAAEEVGLLNRSHPMARFHLHEDRIVARYRVHCWPFSSTQLVFALHQMQERLDDLARDTAARVRGLTFIAAGPPSDPAASPEDGSDEDDDFSLEEFLEGHCDNLGALLELMHEGPVPAPLVASLFDNNPLEIGHRLRMVRCGVTDHGEHDRDEVVAHLRAGLRFLAEHHALKPKRPLPPKPRRSQAFRAPEEAA